MTPFDQFTRWCCPACGEAGVDSWNKEAFDGLDWGNAGPPEKLVFSYYCVTCSNVLLVVCHPSPAHAARAIIAHHVDFPWDASTQAAEDAAFEAFKLDTFAGVELKPSHERDGDWRGGCLNVFALLALPVAHPAGGK